MRDDGSETEAIERDLDDTRSRLDATIGALQQKLAPESMVDQAVHYFREGGGVEFSRNLGRSMRDNPMPLALIGVGLGWLMFAGSRESSRDGSWAERSDPRRDRYADARRSGYGLGYEETSPHQPMPYEAAAYDDLATKAHRAGSAIRRETDETEDAFQDRVHAARGQVLGVARKAGEEAHSFRERVEEAMKSAAERMRAMAADAGSAAGDLADRGQDMARGFYEQGQAAMSDARHRTGQAFDRMRTSGGSAVDYVQDQPLLLGAIGLTVGAVIGMLVPASRGERRMVHSLRGQIGDSARDMAAEAGRRALRVAESTLDAAHDASRREGLTDTSGQGLAAEAHERVADVAGKARQVVQETAAAGREALRRELTGEQSPESERTARGNGLPASAERPAAHGERRPVV